MSDRFAPAELERIYATDGKPCPHCMQTVSINTYSITPTMVDVLKYLAGRTKDQLNRGDDAAVDVRKTNLNHNERSTLSKLRQHGLIAKAKNDDNRHIAGHWLVTTKGFNFLKGGTVPARVEVYDNTVLGHVDGTTTVEAVLKADKPANDPSVIQTERISAAEGQALSHLRERPANTQTMRAVYLPRTYSGSKLIQGEEYDIEISGLTFGRPVMLISPYETTYNDISAFRRAWKVVQA